MTLKTITPHKEYENALERLEKAILRQVIELPLGKVCDLVLMMNNGRSIESFMYVYNKHLQRNDEIDKLLLEVREFQKIGLMCSEKTGILRAAFRRHSIVFTQTLLDRRLSASKDDNWVVDIYITDDGLVNVCYLDLPDSTKSYKIDNGKSPGLSTMLSDFFDININHV